MMDGRITFNEITPSSIEIAWGEVTTVEDFDNYILNLRYPTAMTSLQTAEVASSNVTLEYTFEGLDAGTEYQIEIIVNSERVHTAGTFTRKSLECFTFNSELIYIYCDNTPCMIPG